MSVNITQEKVRELLKLSGAYLEGHFELRSGKHSGHYVEKFRLLERPEIAGQLCEAMADVYRDAGVERVAGPALGGVVIAYEVARSLGVPCAFAERVGDTLTFRRGFVFKPGERVVVVEDIVTTGGSSLKAIEHCESVGLKIERVLAIIDRLEGGREAFAERGYELTTLFTVRDFGIEVGKEM